MSIFSSLKKSRQQAKDHKSKLAEQKKREDIAIPYRHVPTHAAIDAFASAPPSYREADRSRIVEQNRRRSAMAANGHHMNMPGVPRVGSSLSHITYPGHHEAHPVPPLPRAYSYAGVSNYTAASMDVSPSDMAYLQHNSTKGKGIPRSYASQSQPITPMLSKCPSPVESIDGSRSSQDGLEMKTTRSTQFVDANGTHRLHPSRARRKSDASLNQYTASELPRSQQTSQPRDSRPIPTMRAFGSIPAIAALPPVSLDSARGATKPSHHHPADVNYGLQKHPDLGYEESQPQATYNAPAVDWFSPPLSGIEVGLNHADAATGATHQSITNKDTHNPTPYAATRNVSAEAGDAMSKAPMSLQNSSIAPTQPANTLPEVVESGRQGRKASGNGKIQKKHRWASSKAPAVTV